MHGLLIEGAIVIAAKKRPLVAIKRPPLSGLRDVTKRESVHPFGLRLFLAFLHLGSPSFIEGEKVLFSKERSKHVILPYDFKILIKKMGKI